MIYITNKDANKVTKHVFLINAINKENIKRGEGGD
jgi:hypothetical protein